jgi:hypothetical protein
MKPNTESTQQKGQRTSTVEGQGIGRIFRAILSAHSLAHTAPAMAGTTMRTLMNDVFAIALCAFAWLVSPVANAQQQAVPVETLTQAVSCIAHHEFAFKRTPAFAELKSLRVAYLFGKLDEADKPNELHLMIYGGDKKSAMVYEVLVESHFGKKSFNVVNVGVLDKRDAGWTVRETNGGTYSYARVQELVEKLSARAPVTFRRSDLKNEGATCVPF